MSSSRPSLNLPTVGERYDKYSLLAKLATGGMAELFVAQLSGAAGFNKKVVIKRVLPHVAHDMQFTEMFLDEAKTCAKINHPNVCQVFELCEAEGSPFLVLEHLEGATVGELIQRSLSSQQQLNICMSIGIIAQACDGLHAAHEQIDDDGQLSNLVHRDVSPGNLFVTVDGIVKVLDFGIAKAKWMSRKTKTGTLLGKCEYMSPEQARGGTPLDRRSDIFSLGILAWELVCGQRLFRRENEYESLRAVLHDPIERPQSLRPDIPVALDEAIMQALERDPDDRFRTAYEFRQALTLALRGVGGPTAMCEIAPLIRSTFAEELKVQRAVLREASKLASAANERTTALASLESKGEADRHFAHTNIRTSEHQRLLTLQELANHTEVTKQNQQLSTEQEEPTNEPPRPDECDDEQSVELSEDDLLTDETPFLPPQHSSPSPSQAAQATDTHEAREHSHLAQEKPRSNDRRRTVAMLALTLALGAAVTTVSLTWLGGAKPTEEVTAKSESTQRDDAPSARVAPAPTQTRLSQHKVIKVLTPEVQQVPVPIVVSTLPEHKIGTAAKQSQGTLRVLSSLPAKVYLYPEKTLLGTTPLDYVLAPGRYKLKLVAGSGTRRHKKYVQVIIRAGSSTERNVKHW